MHALPQREKAATGPLSANRDVANALSDEESKLFIVSVEDGLRRESAVVSGAKTRQQRDGRHVQDATVCNA